MKKGVDPLIEKAKCFLVVFIIFLFPIGSIVVADNKSWDITIPDQAGSNYGQIPHKLSEYQVILEPDKNEPEWWAGAPSVVRDSEGYFWLACRMRTADAPRGLRGHEIRILQSHDGITFKPVLSIPRDKIPIPGFERPALIIDPVT